MVDPQEPSALARRQVKSSRIDSVVARETMVHEIESTCRYAAGSLWISCRSGCRYGGRQLVDAMSI